MFVSRSASRAGAAVARAPRRCLASASSDAHADAILRVGADPPDSLRALADVLRASGCRPVAPHERDGLHPLVLPLAAEPAGGVLGLLLRPEDAGARLRVGPLPVVRSGPGGIDLVSPDATAHVHRALIEEDAAVPRDADDDARPIARAAGALGARLYAHGQLAASAMPHRPDVFVQRNVDGRFPAVMANLAAAHEAKRDVLSALVTHEWLANEPTFRGWGFPHAHNARALRRHARDDEARDAARVALASSPWWTLGADPGVAREMTHLAGLAATMRARGWGAAELREMLETGGEAHRAAAAAAEGTEAEARAVTPESRAVVAASAAMDAVALGADVDAAKGTAMDWDAVREVVGGCYGDAGMRGLAAFVRREDA